MHNSKWKQAGTFLLILLLYILVMNLTGIGCPIRWLTGIPCPGCGMTRALYALLRLDFSGAFYCHPMIYPLLVFVPWYFFGNTDTPRGKKIDFGIVFGMVDLTTYHAIKIPSVGHWGVLMRRDSPLAHKKAITPDDLQSQPLILSQQEMSGGQVLQWLKCEPSDLNITATYNLIYNASLLVDEGLGYALGFEGLINTTGESTLCFRPLDPPLETEMWMIWKKSQAFSKPVKVFISVLKESLMI